LLATPLTVSGAASVALHVCQSMGGVAVGGCDCDEQVDHGNHDDHGAHGHAGRFAKLEAQPCCTVELSDSSPLVATHEASASYAGDAGFAFVGFGHQPVPRSMLRCGSELLRERAPPEANGPPLFIRHCSFLN
jgi:hypothetical protein